MKPTLEKIEPTFGNSFLLRKFEQVQCNSPEWHFHPEYELHHVVATSGRYFVGDFIGAFEPDNLVLVGPNLPHHWVSDVSDEDVIRALKEWFGSMTDEWEPIRTDRIERAQPVQEVGRDPDQAVRLASGLFVAGDHRQHASINGALLSGRRAGEAVAARLCRD